MSETVQSISKRSLWCAAAFLPSVLFVSTANTVIVQNLVDLSYSPRLTVYFLVLFAFSAMVSGWIFARTPGSRISRGISRLFMFAGFTLILLGTVDAVEESFSVQLSAAVLVDGVCFITLAYLVLRAKFSTICSLAGTLALVLLSYSVVTHATAVYGKLRIDAQRTERFIPPPEKPINTGNVYHILLDGFQREVYQALIESDPALRLDGFEYFPGFTSAYGKTRHSLPNLLTGRVLKKNESLLEWQLEATRGGLWADLAKSGVEITTYPYFEDECPSVTRACHPAMDIGKLAVGHDHPFGPLLNEERQIIDFWFLLLVPRSLQLVLSPYVMEAATDSDGGGKGKPQDFSITKNFLELPQGTGEMKVPNPVPTEGRPAASVYNFRKMLEEEALRPGRGQYVYVHAHLPHGPYTLDQNCEPVGAVGPVSKLIGQSACGIKLIGELLTRLEELQRLEGSVIVIHSDHGAYPQITYRLALQSPHLFNPATRYVEAGQYLGKTLAPSHPPDWLQSGFVPFRSGALLLVKNRNAHGFNTNLDNTQMLDVAPTILGAFGIEHDKYPGYSLFEMPENTGRTSVYFEYEGTSFTPMGRRVFFNKNGEMPSALQKSALKGQKPIMHSYLLGESGWYYEGKMEVDY